MLSNRQEPQVPGKKQIILNFIERAQGAPQEPPEARIRASARPFGDVRWHGDRCADQLIAERPCER